MTWIISLFRPRPPVPKTLISQETAERLKAVHIYYASKLRRLG